MLLFYKTKNFALTRKIICRVIIFTAVGLMSLSWLPVKASEAADVASLLRNFTWRSIGPANMGGRISDIQALDDDYRVVIVASASGGVWKSTNAGTTWTPIFDTYGSASIGAIAIFQKDPNIIWVGTGEANVRNSVSWGDGIYKSTDGGQTFVKMGLKDTHHIAKIVTHPADPDVVYVAAQGHLWGYTGQRGLFKTTDGGKTWVKLTNGLPDDGRTGCTEIELDPHHPDVLYCAFWERIRYPYRFLSGGPNGGIFKSTDGGQTWRRLTEGLPRGDIGRIGLAIYRQNPQIIMAIVEHGYQPRPGTKEYEDMSKLGSGVYRSEDGGETWTFLNRYNNRPFYYSQIYINPLDDQLVYAMGTRAMVSTDGGRTFKEGMPGIAGDFHVMWLDPHGRDRFYVGNDKGVSLTHDQGLHFNFFDNFAIGQIYAISVDMRDPYYVYVGLQDNGVWGGPGNSRDFNGILNDHWFKFHSGDGFYTAIDPTNWTVVYSESQNGRLRRNHALFRQQSVNITPRQENTYNWQEVIPQPVDKDHPVVRKNWNTPFILSPHNPHTIYYGANYLFKSVDRGDHWRVISPDLSTNDPKKTFRESGGLTRDVTGAETHCTITTISESSLKAGLIWAGTDDGQIWLTRNDGQTWEKVSSNLRGIPPGLWVTRVEASHFDEQTAYVTIDGHRSDIFQPFVFKTADFGQSWVNITSNLPQGHCVHVIREDLINPSLLFVGTEFGVFASLDGGKNWFPFGRGLPTVAVHDLVIHPRDGDLIAGTHGRSVWIVDDITPLQQMRGDFWEQDFVLFKNRRVTKWEAVSRGATRGHQLFIGRNPLSMSQVPPSNSPTRISNSAAIHFYLREKTQQPLELRILKPEGRIVKQALIEAEEGFNRYWWDLRFDPSKEEVKIFRQKVNALFDHLREKIKGRLVQEWEGLRQKWNKAKRVEEMNKVSEELMRKFRYLIDRQYFVRPLQGPEAEAGTYIIEMEVKGKVFRSLLAIREDPLKNQSIVDYDQ